MNRKIVLVLCLIGSTYAEDGCVGWDDMVEDMLFAPAKVVITKASADFQRLPDIDQHFMWGTHVKTSNGTVGNLTSFDIVHLDGRPSASYMCQSPNNQNITIALDLTMNDLELNFGNFMANIPVLPEIGDTKTTIRNTGNKVSVSVTLFTNDQSKCVGSLNYLQIQDFGTTTFHFDNGKINKGYQWIISHSLHAVLSTLKYFNLLSSMEKSIEQVAATMVAQQSQQICDILNGGGL